MNNRGILAVTASSLAAVAFAVSVLGVDVSETKQVGDTVAMAPISLGHPAAAATLQTRRPLPPLQESMPSALPATYTQRIKVKSGDTLAKVLSRAGIGRQEAHAAIQALTKHYNPKRIRKGQNLSIKFQSAPIVIAENVPVSNDTFIGLSLEPDYKTVVSVARDVNGTFTGNTAEKTLDRRPVRADGVIENSLYVSGRDAGVPAVVIARLIRLLSWDVDFQRDIRKGDMFEVMYEHVVDDSGKPVYNGNVHYASLTLSGKQVTLYRYTLPDGSVDYFDKDGKASRKALMRTPIDGARLSSRFGKRKHPILGYTKMHKGVDFAAPRGTPIYAAGNGTVAYAGRKGGYGNYIKLRHNGTYETAYAHLKGFARGVRTGKRVEQGQVIGYVGTTGRSTGPHLHYEVMFKKRQVNPLKIRMPSGRALKGEALAAFKSFRDEKDRLFANLRSSELASTVE